MGFAGVPESFGFADVPQSFASSDLVVELAHVGLVLGTLTDLGLLVNRIEQEDDVELGLSLLANLRDANDRAIVDLDALLAELRRQIVARYGGWLPPMGKNRHVANVIGFPQPRSMAAVDPVPAPRPPRQERQPGAGDGVRVGVVDTKLYPHPNLAGSYHAPDDAELHLATDSPVPARAGHATFVADLILAQAPAVDLEVRAVLGDDGKATLWATVRKMASLANSGVDVLNLSLGCRTSDGLPPLVLVRAVERLRRHMLIVAAAGNHGGLVGMTNGVTFRSPTWPAALPDVVAVTAHDGAGGFAPFSPQLPWITCVAPGVDLVGAYLDATVELSDSSQRRFAGYAQWSGTSFAAATVSGAIAARTVPGKVSPQEALQSLLDDPDPDPLVRRYVGPS